MEGEGGKGMCEVQAVCVTSDVLAEIVGHVSEKGAAFASEVG